MSEAEHDIDPATYRCRRCGQMQYAILNEGLTCHLVPAAEQFAVIAARLREIEAEKSR